MSTPRVSRAAGLLAATLAACGPGELRVERPPLSGAKAWVLAIIDGEDLQVWAWADDDPVVVRARLEPETRVEALALAEPLEALGVAPGLQRVVPSDQRWARRIPAPRESWRLDEAAEAWVTQDRPSAALRDLSVEGVSRCRRWKTRVERSPPIGSVRWARPFDAGRALVGAFDGDVVWASPNAAPSAAVSLAPGLRFGAVDVPGRVVVAGAGGRVDLIEASPTGRLLRTNQRIPTRERVIRVAADGLETYALTSSGALWQRRDDRWTERLRRPPDEAEAVLEGGLAKLPGAEAMLVGLGSESELIQVSPTAARDIRVFQNAAGTVALERLADDTFVVGGFAGLLARSRDGQAWEMLGRTPSGLNVTSLTGSYDAFLYGSLYGTIGEYRSDEGFCPELVLDSDRRGAVVGLVELGETVLVVDDGPGSTWVWLEPEPTR